MADIRFNQVAECEHQWRAVDPAPVRWQCARCGVIGRDCSRCGGSGLVGPQLDDCPACDSEGIRTIETIALENNQQ